VTHQIRDQLQSTLGAAYTLERELGGGGMSRVFVAEEARLKRRVVIKVLSPELAQGISVERFEREIQVAAALQQANIVPVLSAGDTNGLPFYTMPFVEGESLRARLAQGPLGIGEVVSILRDVSRALAYAHARGVVHRDIKPDNVLLSGGAAVVTDFGIAKAISASRTQSIGATLTQIGTSIGTPAYMSPEQAAGDPDIDHRADIYSLGAMAFELLGGQAVFAGRTPQRMLAAHMSETPRSIAELRPDTPPALAELVMKCLAKDAAARPQHATDVAQALETTSGGSMAAMPPILLGGPAMFRRALLVYAVAFGAVALLAKAAIVGIGLPDWVFPGSLVVMALGLPVVLWTGYVQRVTRRAMSATPTFTPGGTPAMKVQGTIATMALKASPHVSWYRTARGGLYALGGFVGLIALFMAMRAFGVGPFASLIASGQFAARDRVIITDFKVSNADASLGRVVGDAIRAGLGDSRIFTLVAPAEMASALQRMQLPADARVTLDVARQMAMREGVKAIVDGDVTQVGTSYIVAARLVTADSGRELMSFRGTAKGSDAIIDVADDLSRKLRAKAGESLRKVQATPALAYASTSSLEALRKYSEGMRANDAERDYPKAIAALRQAVALDSNFAEGWRKLAVAITNSRLYPPSATDSALRRAYALRDRMTERERDAVLAYYHSSPLGYDRAQAIATYERMLARGDSAVSLINLGGLARSRREEARAESLFRAEIRRNPGSLSGYGNLSQLLRDGARFAEYDSLMAVVRQQFPGRVGSLNQSAVGIQWDQGYLDRASASFDSARKVVDPRAPSWAVGVQADMAAERGRFRALRALAEEQYAIDSAKGTVYPRAFLAARELNQLAEAALPLDDVLRRFDASVAQVNLANLPESDRPYVYLAELEAKAGRLDRARQWLARYDAEVKDAALRRSRRQGLQHSQAHIAMAERKWNEAARLLRASDQETDGPVGQDNTALPIELLQMWLAAGEPDSAMAAFNVYRKTAPGAYHEASGRPDRRLGAPTSEALAKMFDARGDTRNAARYYANVVEFWKNADAELQPRVKAARERLAALAPVEGRKR
jgi:tRNA A-37 threonylcarbamoyl transferase component Bud32